MKNKIASQFKKGFTILEMLMVLAIFGILTAVIMFNYGEFNSRTILSNLAYEVALSIREAQVYSLGVRGQINETEGNFDNHYGVYFNKVSDKDYAFFVDKEENGGPNGVCDGGDGACLACTADSECLSKSTLTRDITIDKICISSGNDPVSLDTGLCEEENGSIDDVTITFARPNPDSIIYVGSSPQADSSVGIVLTTSYGNKRAVIIRPTGQISVENISTAN